MMNNLFLMFDPSTNLFSLNWLAVLLPLSIIPKKFYFFINRVFFLKILLLMFLKSDLKNNIKVNFQNTYLFFIIIFTFIYICNVFSLVPFIFTVNSHILIVTFLAFPFWLTFMIKGWVYNWESMFIHLVPMGSPMYLIPFMVIIETVSNLIRPLTLSIRLMANMVSGHILISLLSNVLDKFMIMFFPLSVILNVLIVLEISVCLIQAYVFVILISLYMDEV